MLKSNSIVYELVGEIQEDTITTIYGSPGVGKTTLCFEFANECIENQKKVIYIDTEGGFSPERLKQINSEINLDDLVVFSPKSFEEQHKIIVNLNKEIKNRNQIGLVIVDSLVMLYRLKLADTPQKINTELGEQLRLLTEVSRNFKIPIIVTNQMYKDFDTKQNKMVGGTVIDYWSKTIVELEKDGDLKKATLIKHKFRKEGKEILFEIKNSGLEKMKSRGFNLFKS